MSDKLKDKQVLDANEKEALKNFVKQYELGKVNDNVNNISFDEWAEEGTARGLAIDAFFNALKKDGKEPDLNGFKKLLKGNKNAIFSSDGIPLSKEDNNLLDKAQKIVDEYSKYEAVANIQTKVEKIGISNSDFEKLINNQDLYDLSHKELKNLSRNLDVIKKNNLDPKLIEMVFKDKISLEDEKIKDMKKYAKFKAKEENIGAVLTGFNITESNELQK